MVDILAILKLWWKVNIYQVDFKASANETVTVDPFDASYEYCLLNGASNESQNYTNIFEEETVIRIAFNN